MSAATLETTRREWEESSARLEAESADRGRYVALLEQVEVISAELRRCVGQTFTLAELVDAYVDAERWARPALTEAEAPVWWPRTLTTVVGAAFDRYARGATDYRP